MIFAIIVIMIALGSCATTPLRELVEAQSPPCPEGTSRREYGSPDEFSRWCEDDTGARRGAIVHFALGRKIAEGPLEDGKLHGVYRGWTEAGRPLAERSYVAGRRHGISRTWWESGRLRELGCYVDDEKRGLWRRWDAAGDLIETVDHGAAPDDVCAGANELASTEAALSSP